MCKTGFPVTLRVDWPLARPQGINQRRSDPGLRQATRRKKAEAIGPQRLMDDIIYEPS
jgi:hypothetical protein